MTIRRKMPKFDPEKFDPVPEAVSNAFPDPHEIDGNLIMEEGDYGDDHNDNPTDPLDELREDNPPPPGLGVAALDGVIVTMADQMVGRTIEVGADTLAARAVELITLKSQDKLNSMFSVAIGIEGQRVITPQVDPRVMFNAFPSFDTSPCLNGANDGNPLQGTFAIIQWGAGAAQFETVVDIQPGQVFTVGGSFLRIKIANQNQDNAGNYAAIQARCFVSLLPKGSQRHSAQLTVPVKNIAASGQSVLAVPPFARRVKFARNNAAKAFTLEFWNAQNATITQEVIAANEHCPEFEIPAQATNIVVVNSVGATLTGQFILSMDL